MRIFHPGCQGKDVPRGYLAKFTSRNAQAGARSVPISAQVHQALGEARSPPPAPARKSLGADPGHAQSQG